MIVLDTNVISEFSRPAPDTRVVDWFRTLDTGEFATTTINEAEILMGLALLPQGRKRDGLLQGAIAVLEVFGHRIYAFDRDAARLYPQIVLERRAVGLATDIADGQIAAIARARRASVATRNTVDFIHGGIEIVNPWTA